MMGRLFLFLEWMTNPNDPNKFRNFIYWLFIPVFYILELITYFYFWKKVIIPELLTSDEIVNIFDKNDFVYKGNKLIKMDLVKSNPYFDRMNLEEANSVIKAEWVNTIVSLIEKNCNINIEEYINLTTDTNIKIIKIKGENYRSKIYTVTIQFCRQYYIDKAKIKLFQWLLSITIATLIFIGLNLYLISKFHW